MDPTNRDISGLHCIEFENYEFKITVTSSQWVKVVEAAQILPYGRQEPTCLTLSAS